MDPSDLSLAGDGTPVVTSARERKHPACDCSEKGITACSCNRFFSQPDCDIGWDSSRDCFYFGYDLYMLVVANSESDLPVFPLLNPTSKHDSHGFLETWFRMKVSFLIFTSAGASLIPPMMLCLITFTAARTTSSPLST